MGTELVRAGAAVPLAKRTELDGRQLAYCKARAVGASQRATCRELDIPRSVAQAWEADSNVGPMIRQRIAAIQDARRARAQARLLGAAEDAIDACIDTVRQQPADPPSHAERLAAAKVLLQGGGVIATPGSSGATVRGSDTVNILQVTPETFPIVEARFLARMRAAQERKEAEARERDRPT